MISEEIQEKLNQFLIKNGLRRTRQRQVILETIFSSDEHFTAEELIDRIHKLNVRGSRATIYRTLNLLEEAGLLKEIDLGDELKHYDPNIMGDPHHAHLICVDCGKVVEFADENLKILEDCLVRRMGFRPAHSSLRIEACCEKLRQFGRCENLIKARLSGKRLPRRR